MRLLAAAAAAVLLLAVPALAETNVGVTAAVNQSASGTTGSNVRTISLGDSVIYNERIQTGGDGLVQILLADGTTFMVGPNSDLVIDSFVYDPNAGTAQVTASFTKGVLRFIGGQTSKTEGGVTLNTPVGTMGIRGAMVDVVLDPPSGTPQHIDMLFGNEVTLEQGQQLLGRLYAAGYSLVLGEGGTIDVMKTPPGWGSQIQAALAGKPGTKGGAPKGPTEDEVGNSEFAENNQPGDPPGLTDKELDQLLEAAAQYDELRNFILNNQSPQGFVGGVLRDNYGNSTTVVTAYEAEYDEAGPVSYEATHAALGFDADGNPVAIDAKFLLTIPCGDCSTETYTATYQGGDGSGQLVIDLPELPNMVIPTIDSFLYAHDDERDDNFLNALAYDDDVEDNYQPTLADTLECDCESLVRWGFWGYSLDDVEVGEVEGDLDFIGTWVTGDLTTAAQLNTLGGQAGVTATYYGDAVGVVNNSGLDPAYQNYVATGEMEMTWGFDTRTGRVDISGFDMENTGGLNFGYDVSSPEGANGFLGWFEESGEYDYAGGNIQGGFVNGDTDAQGVIGNWDYVGIDYYNYYKASGVFMGAQPTD